jgi:hypothetical protein
VVPLVLLVRLVYVVNPFLSSLVHTDTDLVCLPTL